MILVWCFVIGRWWIRLQVFAWYWHLCSKMIVALFLEGMWNWLVLSASDIPGCILTIVWKKSSKSSKLSLFPLKTNVFVVVGLASDDDVWCCCWDAIPVIASARLLMGLPESEFWLCCVCPFTVKVLSCEVCVAMFYGWVNCSENGLLWKGIRLVRNSGILFSGAISPITMWWAWSCRL